MGSKSKRLMSMHAAHAEASKRWGAGAFAARVVGRVPNRCSVGHRPTGLVFTGDTFEACFERVGACAYAPDVPARVVRALNGSEPLACTVEDVASLQRWAAPLHGPYATTDEGERVLLCAALVLSQVCGEPLSNLMTVGRPPRLSEECPNEEASRPTLPPDTPAPLGRRRPITTLDQAHAEAFARWGLGSYAIDRSMDPPASRFFVGAPGCLLGPRRDLFGVGATWEDAFAAADRAQAKIGQAVDGAMRQALGAAPVANTEAEPAYHRHAHEQTAAKLERARREIAALRRDVEQLRQRRPVLDFEELSELVRTLERAELAYNGARVSANRSAQDYRSLLSELERGRVPERSLIAFRLSELAAEQVDLHRAELQALDATRSARSDLQDALARLTPADGAPEPEETAAEACEARRAGQAA